MKLAILITTRNHPQRIEQLLRRIESSVTIPHDVFVAECGPDVHDFPDATVVRMEDLGHRDDCGGLTLALEAARKAGRHDYYWILTEEVSFDADTDVVLGLIDRLERERLMAIAAPTWNQVGFSPRPDPTSPDGWRAVASCELRGFVMKADAIEDVGFLNTEFVYGIGAMHELCHRLYSAGWFVVRCEDVVLRLNAATVLERKADYALEHYARACRFAYEWFRSHHGEEWDATFWGVTRGLGVEENPFASDKTHWSRCYDERASAAPPAPAPAAPQRAPSATPAPAARSTAAAAPATPAPRVPAPAPAAAPARAVIARLNLGSGSDYRPGWINVDLDPISGADLIAHAEALPMFASGTIDVIEARQLLPYLGYFEAQAALREWARLLRPGGELLLELPDLEACVAALGRHADERGLDPALTGLYGEPRQGATATYRWAWSRTSLTAALREAGFDAVQFEPTNRCQGVAGFARDMRARSKRTQASGVVRTHVEQVAPATPAPARGRPARSMAAGVPDGAVDISAWPIATDAALRIFAWPDYDHAAELEMMFNVYGRHLIGRRDVCLVLRQDKRVDGTSSFVRAKLELAHGRSVGRDAEIDVLLVDEDLSDADWQRLGRSVDCALLLPSSHAQRRELLTALGVPLVENTDQLLLHLPAQVQPSVP